MGPKRKSLAEKFGARASSDGVRYPQFQGERVILFFQGAWVGAKAGAGHGDSWSRLVPSIVRGIWTGVREGQGLAREVFREEELQRKEVSGPEVSRRLAARIEKAVTH